MKLLIDIGNTRLKWAIAQHGNIQNCHVVAYREQDLKQVLLADWQFLMPDAVYIASVADAAVLRQTVSLSEQLWPCVKPQIPKTTATACGVENAYQQPEKLGIDRWLALLAVRQHYPGHACIVDCGTAITIDVINAQGRHLGGLICPGLQLMKKALLNNTAALSADRSQFNFNLADNTAAAINNGSLFAAIGAIETVVSLADPTSQLIITGGDAQLIASYLRTPTLIDEQLVLKGLSLL